MWEDYRSFLKGFTISRETAAIDVVREVGHGNTFLTHPHTAKNFKNEITFLDKKKLAYEATLSSKMVKDAKVVVRKALKEHRVQPLEKGIISKGNALLKSWEKSI